MEYQDTPYVWRDEVEPDPDHDPEGRDTVIVDGEAMTYRRYCYSRSLGGERS